MPVLFDGFLWIDYELLQVEKIVWNADYSFSRRSLLHSGRICGILLCDERKYNICGMKYSLAYACAFVLCAVNRVIVYSPQASVTLTVKPFA